jgi:predicted metal-dependent hydrolase
MTIERRDVELDLDASAVPRDWYADDAYSTTFLDALSMLFPEGERFFLESVKRFRMRIDDPALRADVDGFIGQEAMHGREHRAFNEMLAAHGFGYSARVDGLVRWILRIARKMSPRSQLAITCALEHFTAMLAEQVLETDRIRDEIHPTMRALWIWHALEESEHKAVAYDVYRAVGGGYVRRIALMVLTSIIFVTVQGGLHARLMFSRGIWWKPWRWLRGIRVMWIWPGNFTRLIPRYFTYYRPGFHPNDRDNTALVARWRDALFGDGGELRQHVRAAA